MNGYWNDPEYIRQVQREEWAWVFPALRKAPFVAVVVFIVWFSLR